ncbi:protein ABSCISIC ACID-INSENSITIVE 5-like [Carya illinoinensis]|uniref:BZIP domain-containing protein n=1 Tax=Carya illinoinensis TaxID=32201 RepID=A0A8T1PFX5_CARIL|nr:protein ABSCISIC ACID-INSENSITIVE 5-like [Carya illinoinensis]XP_042941180.1 protein ABSCISIC ACID-INSENSITIVE 5-like [Carya illinoinensis]XP_042941181.1 protein ABSCISIC ACID-INSENSITIVE 5-like [Carya illinoinensis]XP_042941182.1 protein ABSCISIC ACID-INSENSITIVE 5-like [Carya illinoinensis]XP_042941183.1 protein ABSCISIC ACID-INSENSITIVE 5-like [Carya illinoinensis]KAG6640574.1 hypothetical protein CIPAW_09G013200 [Carya illinoinensis]KAG6640575.1 hypothetical protein CIPAW_09G013200 [Ca
MMTKMVATESEMIPELGQVESSLLADQQPKINRVSSLGRQSSVYSLTLDEFQHTLCESGKNFGSMNMDEFLTSIWIAEENQAVNNTTTTTNVIAANNMSSHTQLSQSEAHTEMGKAKQPSLPRQGSLTLPAPLCRKTVDEVWSEIHKGQHQSNSTSHKNGDNIQNPECGARQPTFEEMTLEDFLIKAGVVREPCTMPVSQPQPQQQYGLYQNNNSTAGPSFSTRSTTGFGVAGGVSTVPTHQTMPQGGGGAIGESSGYAGNGKRSGGYPPGPPAPVCYGGRVVNGGGGYGAAPAMGVVAPVSPASSDGLCTTQVDNSGNQFGLDMGELRGRKRIIDGPVEKVVERRQRRMIKNRESAARSRARKQAYTVELEAELNQLRDENTNLKQALVEIERKRNQQYSEEMKTKVQTKAQKAKEKLRVLKRNQSCPL